MSKYYRYLLPFLYVLIINSSAAMSPEEISHMTQGLGVFKITLSNPYNMPKAIYISAQASTLTVALKTVTSERVSLAAHETKEILAIKPFFGRWPYYKGNGPRILMVKVELLIAQTGKVKSFQFPAAYTQGTLFAHIENFSYELGAEDLISAMRSK